MKDSIFEIRTILKKKIEGKLPGQSAHQILMPNRKPIPELGEVIKGARKSAVLILIYPKNNQCHVVLIQRHTYKGSHSNQIGFPGGKIELEDISFQAAALREANEELMIESSNVEVIGRLSELYIPPSNFIVYPFIAVQTFQPVFRPDAYEVKEVLEIPLNHFTKSDALIEKKILLERDNYINVKGYPYLGRMIWGATGMIMTELRMLLTSTNKQF